MNYVQVRDYYSGGNTFREVTLDLSVTAEFIRPSTIPVDPPVTLELPSSATVTPTTIQACTDLTNRLQQLCFNMNRISTIENCISAVRILNFSFLTTKNKSFKTCGICKAMDLQSYYGYYFDEEFI